MTVGRCARGCCTREVWGRGWRSLGGPGHRGRSQRLEADRLKSREAEIKAGLCPQPPPDLTGGLRGGGLLAVAAEPEPGAPQVGAEQVLMRLTALNLCEGRARTFLSRDRACRCLAPVTVCVTPPAPATGCWRSARCFLKSGRRPASCSWVRTAPPGSREAGSPGSSLSSAPSPLWPWAKPRRVLTRGIN